MENAMNIERQQMEIAKLQAETAKLIEESLKMRYEGRKYQRETLFYPFVAEAGLLGAAIALVKIFLP